MRDCYSDLVNSGPGKSLAIMRPATTGQAAP